jgi:hypothetical protein
MITPALPEVFSCESLKAAAGSLRGPYELATLGGWLKAIDLTDPVAHPPFPDFGCILG